MFKNIKRLAGFIGEYKLPAILTPIIVSLEVIMECLIPFFSADLITYVQSGFSVPEGDAILTVGLINFVENKITPSGASNDTRGIYVIGAYCIILIVMALLSLSFGAIAGLTCSKASCGFAKNLRTGLFNKSQDFSFENIDKFSTSSLWTG